MLSTDSPKFIISLYETSHTKNVQNYTQIINPGEQLLTFILVKLNS